jgi:chromate transporter
MSSETEASSLLPESIPYAALTPNQQRQRLRELGQVFLRLGTIAFGGPAAHIAMMDQEVVNQRHWMSHEKLLDLLGITHLIPGPNSTELAIHIGYERAGWRGLVVAGSSFILPAMLIVWGLAAIYQRYQTVPQVGWLLYGIKPVIIAIVLQAVWNLGKKAIKDVPTIVVAMGAIVAFGLGWNEVMVLILSGLVVTLVKNTPNRSAMSVLLLPRFGGEASIGALAATTATTVTAVSWSSLFLFFLKIGCVLYGSGYVLLAFLQRDLVERHHWLTSQQLLDAIAIGQLTPGPVFTTATFIGYLLAGHAGAIAATLGIFLPAFVLVLVVNPWVPKLRQSAWASGGLDGVNAASLGLMVGVTWTLAQTALVDGVTLLVAGLSTIAVFRFKVSSAWLVVSGGAIGWVAHLFGFLPG